MKGSLVVGLVIVLVAGCSTRSLEGDPTSLDRVEFFVPAGWAKDSRSTSAHGEWMPAENVRSESISVISVGTSKLAPFAVPDLLAQAQRALQDGSFSAPKQFTTRRGLVGFRVEGEFVPVGKTEKYRRIHAALLDGLSIVHVLYTDVLRASCVIA